MKKALLHSMVILGVSWSIVGCGSGSSTYDSQVEDRTPSELSQELKDSITFMYSEESLAHDIYLALNLVQPSNTFYNIATNSETKHIDAVNDLAVSYDLNMTQYPDTDVPYSINGIGNGTYIDPIKDLYNLLYAKGEDSLIHALEVGCIVEVVDVEDLDEAISLAEQDNASDVLDVFNFLRNGSYTHYWAFDKALITQGIVNGCCSVPDMLGHNFCHPEYPKK